MPYPWPKYAQTTVADFFGGMENVSATTLVDWLPDARAYQDRPWYQHILIPHELAHQWFGDYVTTENWANTWLNEGFAEFMPGQYWTQKLGARAGQDYYADEYRQFMNIEGRRPMPLASMGSNNIYPKGALVLEMLRRYLGDDRFWAGVHRYLTDHAYGVATTDDLRQAFLDATGENLDWFWREWIYGAGYPSFTVTSQFDAASHRVTIVARQTQRDSLKADSTGLRFVIPEAFTMPVTIRVGTAAGDVVRQAWIRQREDTIVVDGVMSEPTMMVFDDGNRILKSLAFDQPTAWLATQLRHDADLWDREWALSQLAKRPTDAAAARAVADAVTSADHPYTRAIAASAMDAFPADVALPALARALRDTSARVRASAAGGLGGLGGPEALDARAHGVGARLELHRSGERGDGHRAARSGRTTRHSAESVVDAVLSGRDPKCRADRDRAEQRHEHDRRRRARRRRPGPPVARAGGVRGARQPTGARLAHDQPERRSWVGARVDAGGRGVDGDASAARGPRERAAEADPRGDARGSRADDHEVEVEAVTGAGSTGAGR